MLSIRNNLIYDDWYRDEQRVDYSYYNNGDEATTADKYFLLKRGKRFDYFTSSLLEPQLGDPVDIPLGNMIKDGSWYSFNENLYIENNSEEFFANF